MVNCEIIHPVIIHSSSFVISLSIELEFYSPVSKYVNEKEE